MVQSLTSQRFVDVESSVASSDAPSVASSVADSSAEGSALSTCTKANAGGFSSIGIGAATYWSSKQKNLKTIVNNYINYINNIFFLNVLNQIMSVLLVICFLNPTFLIPYQAKPLSKVHVIFFHHGICFRIPIILFLW